MSSTWWELSVAAVDGEVAEALAEVWRRSSATGVVVEESDPADEVRPQASDEPRFGVRLFLEDDAGVAVRLDEARRSASWLQRIRPFPEPVLRRVDAEVEAARWRERHGRLRVGARLVVMPPWDEDPLDPELLAVVIEPGNAFGVGSHPTTRLALGLLEVALQPGDRVWDVGCGSGVLGVAAARLGAASVAGCDIDPAAVEATRAAARSNGVEDRVAVARGSVEVLPDPAPELCVMNIVADVLLRLIPEARARLGDGGRWVLSGILAEREDEVRAAMPGARVVERRVEGDWVALWLSSPPEPPGA